jgi:hypothetical protein
VAWGGCADFSDLRCTLNTVRLANPAANGPCWKCFAIASNSDFKAKSPRWVSYALLIVDEPGLVSLELTGVEPLFEPILQRPKSGAT